MSKKVAGRAGRACGSTKSYPEEFSLYTAGGARKYLNQAERQRVLAALAALLPERRLFALTLVWTGARVSEVLALSPSSFQIERGIVAFRTLKRRRHAVREVPIPPALMTALNYHFSLAERQSDPDRAHACLWRFCRQTGWRIIKAAMATAAVYGIPACPRGLRHAFGVGSLQAGVPLNLVQRWLGHARMSTTAIYAAACGPEERDLAAKFWRLGGYINPPKKLDNVTIDELLKTRIGGELGNVPAPP